MFESCYNQSYDSFSTTLLCSLTLENQLLQETKHIYRQTDLMENMMGLKSDKNMSLNCDTTVSSQNLDAKEGLDQSFRTPFEPSFDCQRSSQMRTSLFWDCRLKRIQQQDEILEQIQSNCSQQCFIQVKNVLQKSKKKSSELKRQLKEIESIKKLNEKYLKYKSENMNLKSERQKDIDALSAYETEKHKLKALQQKHFKKQASLLKREQAIALKQKKLLQIKKKIEAIFNLTGENISKAMVAMQQCKQNMNPCAEDISGQSLENVKAVKTVWTLFGNSFQSKLQQ